MTECVSGESGKWWGRDRVNGPPIIDPRWEGEGPLSPATGKADGGSGRVVGKGAVPPSGDVCFLKRDRGATIVQLITGS